MAPGDYGPMGRLWDREFTKKIETYDFKMFFNMSLYDFICYIICCYTLSLCFVALIQY